MMPDKDIAEKSLEWFNDVFADIVNAYFAFNGGKNGSMIQPDDLQDTKARSLYKSDGEIHEQERDTVKLWKSGEAVISLLGIENQTGIDPLMALRVFGYEGGDYRWQLTQKGLKPYPVITIVLYFGTERRWTQPRTLIETLDAPDYLRPFMNDCRLNVLELAWLTNEQIKAFKSDFRYIAKQVQCARTGEEFMPEDGYVEHPDALFKLMGALTGDQRFEAAINDFYKKGERVMIKSFLDNVEARGISIGEARGISIGEARGEERARRSIMERLIAGGISPQQAAAFTGLNA